MVLVCIYFNLFKVSNNKMAIIIGAIMCLHLYKKTNLVVFKALMHETYGFSHKQTHLVKYPRYSL